MKKIILLLLTISLFSCTPDYESDGPLYFPQPVGKLKSVSNSSGITMYYYNGNGDFFKTVLTGIDGVEYSTIFSIEDDKLTGRFTSINGVPDFGVTYTYSGNKIIKSVSNEGEYIDSKEFQYDISGKLTKEIYNKKSPNSTSFSLVSTTDFIYNGDKIVEEVINVNGGGNYTITYEYDNKKNPYYEILPSEYSTIERIHQNNILKRNSGITEYEYNSSDFPLKSIFDGGVTTYQYY